MKNQILLSFFMVALVIPAISGAVVVIDPGHGGADEGTVYQNKKLRITEKYATLLLAQQVAEELRAKNIPVILTRTEDRDVPLGTRTALANQLHAELFLSIHLNSSEARKDAEGIETYILNNATDESSRRLAALENTVLGPRSPKNSETQQQEDVDVALILRDLTLDANLAESKRLACMIHHHLMVHISRNQPNVKNRGVKQALFHVLLGAEMPSALVEAGFLNHHQDREFLISPHGKKVVGIAIARAIDHFLQSKGTPQARSTLSKCKIN